MGYSLSIEVSTRPESPLPTRMAIFRSTVVSQQQCFIESIETKYTLTLTVVVDLF
jgi:hypothetical protein